jgi:hypothetical protein
LWRKILNVQEYSICQNDFLKNELINWQTCAEAAKVPPCLASRDLHQRPICNGQQWAQIGLAKFVSYWWGWGNNLHTILNVLKTQVEAWISSGVGWICSKTLT